MKNRYYIPLILGCLLSFSFLFTSCDDDDGSGNAPRLFTPVVKEIVVTGNTIRLNWDKYAGTEKYAIAISQDTFRTEPIAVFETDTTFYLITDLQWDADYQVSIQALGNNISSYVAVSTGMYTAFPTKLITPTGTDVIDNAVRVKWQLDDEAYTNLDVINSQNEVVKTVEVTPEEYETGEMIISGLSPKTTYRVIAYTGDSYKGRKSYTTLAAQVFEGNMVDLRELSDEEANEYITTDFIAGLEDNTTVVLSGGTVYKMSGGELTTKALKFITGYSLRGKAEFSISSELKLPAGDPISKIEFEGIYFYTPDVDETTANYGGKYIFNANPGNADLISFENCEFRYFRGLVRLRSSVVGKVVINNCIIDRIGGYGLMNVDNNTSIMEEMVLTNSTITYTDRGLRNTYTLTNTVLVDNCTFCYSPVDGGGSNIMFDFSASAPDVTIKNSIFGPTTTGVNGGGYFRAATSPNVSNCYATSDYKVATNATTGLEVNPLPDIIIYSKSSEEVFKDPLNFDFTIVDNSFPGKSDAGDPRWR